MKDSKGTAPMNTNPLQISLADYIACGKAARLLKLSPHTIRSYMTRGLIQGIKVGTNWLIPITEINRYREERQRVGRPRSA